MVSARADGAAIRLCCELSGTQGAHNVTGLQACTLSARRCLGSVPGTRAITRSRGFSGAPARSDVWGYGAQRQAGERACPVTHAQSPPHAQSVPHGHSLALIPPTGVVSSELRGQLQLLDSVFMGTSVKGEKCSGCDWTIAFQSPRGAAWGPYHGTESRKFDETETTATGDDWQARQGGRGGRGDGALLPETGSFASADTAAWRISVLQRGSTGAIEECQASAARRFQLGGDLHFAAT